MGMGYCACYKSKLNESEKEFRNNDKDENSKHSERKVIEIKLTKNGINLFLTFGIYYKERHIKFIEAYEKMFKFSLRIKTTLYTLSFEKVKEIIEIFKTNKEVDFIISDEFYNKLINQNFKRFEDHIYDDNIYKIFSEIDDIRIEIIKSTLNIFLAKKDFNINNMTYIFIKYFQDIGFCIRFFYYLLRV